MTKMYTAAEIIALNLPLLPKTKPSILARAEKEGWTMREVAGNGGVRKVFELPEHYFSNDEGNATVTIYAAKQAVSQAFKAMQVVGGMTEDQFVNMFLLLCKVDKPTQEIRESQSANTQRAQKAKAGKGALFNIGSQTAGGEIRNITKIKGDLKQ